ncbi:MAG TPA: Mu-like prophage major head subunit gpT family protein, partial [Chloroflexota bacterium]|nr:Mu-like prophage major head subunit gpT family protein [Chloroflexota bacterium]
APRLNAAATLRVFEHAGWLRSMAREVLTDGGISGEVMGLSIDAVAVVKPGRPADMTKEVPVVEEIVELRSVDVVTRASAGGAFVGVKESEDEVAGDGCQVSGEEVRGEEMRGEEVEGAEGVLREAQRVLVEVKEAQMVAACGRALEERLSAAVEMPEPVRAKLRQQLAPEAGQFSSVAAYTAVLEQAVTLEMDTLTAVLRGGELRGTSGETEQPGGAGTRLAAQEARGLGASVVTGNGIARVVVSEVERQRLVAQVGMDRLFGLTDGDGMGDADVARARELGLLAGAPRWGGIREAYVQLTGDALVTGAVNAEASVVREANEVTSGVLNFALLNSMTKRLVRDYKGQPQDWRKFCSVVGLQDFKSQDRVRLHDFASLATVAEGAAYANLAWDDTREAYAPSKRGNLVVVTREAILNDDLRAIRRIPQKLARAAGITMNEFVYGLFTSNPFMSDGSKVFDDGVQVTHVNRGTTALSGAALQAAITSMLKQPDSAGKRLNLKPRYLLVPSDLLFTALTIVNSTLVPGSANNDTNVLKGAVEPIPVAQFTDATDYYLMCDPADIESVEVGFVGGREEPELLMQDRPDQGQVFTNDQISFKIRWEFGGGWLDYRGAFWGNVSG